MTFVNDAIERATRRFRGKANRKGVDVTRWRDTFRKRRKSNRLALLTMLSLFRHP